MTGAGFSEANTFGFIGKAAAEPFAGDAGVVAIANPLSENFGVLRPSCLPGLVAAVAYNRHREQRDVRLFEIRDRASGDLLANAYMDLFPREGKFSHAAAFPLVVSHRTASGEREPAVSAIVANFTPPTSERPALLRHDEVLTLFHEWGHLTGARLSGGIVHFPKRVTSTFLFYFDTKNSSRQQFLSMSLGGFAASAVVTPLLIALLPSGAISSYVAMVLIVAGLVATAWLELPLYFKVLRGAPLPRGFVFRSDAQGA